jgi:hypothetical protein
MNCNSTPECRNSYSFQFINTFSKRQKVFAVFVLCCSLIFSSKIFGQSVNSFHNENGASGCGQGYWKTHTDLWDEASDAVPFSTHITIESLGLPYSQASTTNALYKDVFGVSTAQMIAVKLDPDLTLEQAINSGGGGFTKLARQSIAALLNATATNFPYTPAQVLTFTHDAITSKISEPLATQFDNENEGHCVFGIPPTCDLTGPTLACPETNLITYTTNVDLANGAVTYQWILLNNTAGASLSGNISGTSSTTPITINVVPTGTDFIPGGHFNLEIIVTRSIYSKTCYINSETSPGDISHIEKTVLSCAASPSVISFCSFLVLHDQYVYCNATNFPPPITQLNINFAGSDDTDPSHYFYLWTENGGGSLNSATIMNPVYTAVPLDGEPNFTVRVINKVTGCVTICHCSVVVTVGGGKPINPDIAAQNDLIREDNPIGNRNFTIYPNPTNGTAQIIIPDNIHEVDMHLIDLSGKTVQRWYGIKTQSIHLKNIKPGIYLLRIISKNTGQQMTKKIIIL